MKRPRTRTSKTRRWIELLLLFAGMIAIGIWAWSNVRRAVFQSWANRVLQHQIDSRPVHAPPTAPLAKAPAPLANGALIGRLEIPRLNLRAVVREGAGQDTLDVALGHIPGTALPGQAGNVGVAGHRDTLFRGLRNIEKNDVIQFQTPAGSYQYQVESTGIVQPKDVGLLDSTPRPEMTLVTCYPFYYVGSAPDRFIVKARLMRDPAPAPAAPVAAAQPASPPPPGAPQPPPAVHRSRPAIRRVDFHVNAWHSQELTPGIRLSLSSANASRQRASVRMFVTPEGHTISLKNQPAHQPVFFHGHDDGRQRELMITRVNANSVTGYLLLYGSTRDLTARRGLDGK